MDLAGPHLRLISGILHAHIVETQTLITSLATHAHDIRIGDAPAHVRRQAALCFLDTVGCMVAGLKDPGWHAIAAMERRRRARAEGR